MVNLVIRQSVYINVPEPEYIDYLWELIEPDQLDEDTVIMCLEQFLDEFIFDSDAEMRCSRFPELYDWLLKVEEAVNELEGDPEDVDLIFHTEA